MSFVLCDIKFNLFFVMSDQNFVLSTNKGGLSTTKDICPFKRKILFTALNSQRCLKCNIRQNQI